MIPFVDTLVRRHVRQQTIRCEHQEIVLKDQTVFYVSAMAIFRVTDVYHALFEIRDLELSVDELCKAALRGALSKRKLADMTDTDQMAPELLAEIRAGSAGWGVEFSAFRLTNCSPTEETAKLMLISAQAEQRAKALNASIETINFAAKDLNPALAAAIIGIPVATTIGSRQESN